MPRRTFSSVRSPVTPEHAGETAVSAMSALIHAGQVVHRSESKRTRTAHLQDRPDRRLGAGRALPPRRGAGDLATRPARARRTRACTLAASPRPASLEPEA